MESKNNWKAWLYLAPALILMAVFTFYPLINTFVISFLKDFDYRSGAKSGFTFDNYGLVLGIVENVPGVPESQITDFVQYALPNTLLITFVTVPISILIALLIAIGINSIPKLQKLLQTIFFMPYVTNVIAVGMVFAIIFSDKGIFNNLFGLTGTKWVSLGASWGNSMTILCLYIIWSA